MYIFSKSKVVAMMYCFKNTIKGSEMCSNYKISRHEKATTKLHDFLTFYLV